MDQQNNNPEHTPGTSVPPPPSEVGVRTMVSDIASVAQSGGSYPKPYPIRVASRSEQERETSVPAASRPGSSPLYFLLKPAFLFPALGIVLAGVFLAAYLFVYPLLNPKPATVATSTAPTVTQQQTFEHKSVFSQPADGTFILDIASPVSGLKAEGVQVGSFVNSVSGSFFEITPRNGAGQPLSAGDFFSSIDADVLGTDFLAANFENDFTFFLYKDQGGLWPGYILQLKTGESPILLQNTVLKKMEDSGRERVNLFLASPGLPASTQFQSGLSSGQPIWFFNYSNASSAIAYGWFFNKYLTISTSLEGLKQAIAHF